MTILTAYDILREHHRRHSNPPRRVLDQIVAGLPYASRFPLMCFLARTTVNRRLIGRRMWTGRFVRSGSGFHGPAHPVSAEVCVVSSDVFKSMLRRWSM